MSQKLLEDDDPYTREELSTNALPQLTTNPQKNETPRYIKGWREGEKYAEQVSDRCHQRSEERCSE